MAVYVTKRCSRCGDITEPRHRDDEGFKIGNPLSVCHNCGALLVDKSKKEYIMFKPFDYVRYFFLKVFLGIFIGFLIGGIAMAVIDENNTAILWIIGLIIFVGWMALTIKNFNDDKLYSIKQTKNIKYLNQLYQTGLITEEQKRDFMNLYNITEEKDEKIETKTKEEKRKDSKSDSFSTEDLAGGILESAFNQVKEIEPILKANKIDYSYKELVISTFAFYSSIFVAHISKLTQITFGQYEDLNLYILNRFNEFNKVIHEEDPETEEKDYDRFKKLFREAKKEAETSMKKDGSFVDSGISNQYLESFLEEEDITKVKMYIVAEILGKWVVPATKMCKKIEID